MTTQPDTFVHRGWTLTGLGRAYLASDERVTPADLFTPEQYDAIRNAGYDVTFVRAERLLGVTS